MNLDNEELQRQINTREIEEKFIEKNFISKDKIRKRIEELEDLEVDNEVYEIALKLAKKELQHLLEE